MLPCMDDQRAGRTLRAIRLHRRRRQVEIARTAGISQSSMSRIERGHLGSLTLDTLRGVAAALEATLDVGIRWRGGEADRIVGARHTAMTERVVPQLDRVGGWQWAAETSFSAWGERGVIDVLAWHAARHRLLVIELKTELVDPAALLAQVDRYRRLAQAVARERGWGAAGARVARGGAAGGGAAPTRPAAGSPRPAAGSPRPAAGPGAVACWVVVADTSSNRARLARHRTMLRGTFPVDGRQMASWLADPREPIMALSFLRDMPGQTGTRMGPVRRVRGGTRGAAASRPASVADPGSRPDQAAGGHR
jgi:transcriptional regulator with XRE-family HTH domain